MYKYKGVIIFRKSHQEEAPIVGIVCVRGGGGGSTTSICALLLV